MSSLKRIVLSWHAIVLAVAVVGVAVFAALDGLSGIAFFNALFLVGATIPLALCLTVQFGICRRKKIPFQLVSSSPDVLIFLLAPLTWSCAIELGCSKSLSNLVEVPLIGSAWGICIAIRTFLVLRNNPRAIWLGSWLTVILTVAISTLVGIFFPGLPE